MIAIGFGFTSKATIDSLQDAYDLATSGALVQIIATAEDKAEMRVMRHLSKRLNLPVLPVPHATLTVQSTLTRSDHSLATYGTGSVAEAAALAAAGLNAALRGPRVVSADRQATCAIAEGGAP